MLAEHIPAPANRKSLMPVVIFTTVYMVLFFLAYLRRGNLEFLYYVAILVIVIPLVAYLHLRISLNRASLWCLSLWGLLHMAGGLVPVPEGWPIYGETRVLYSLWILPGALKYDHVVHAFGFGVTTWICWQGLQSLTARPVRPTLGPLVLCIAAGMGFGAFNETLEFFAVLALPETNVGGYRNTGWDLVSNLAGCLLAAGLIRTWRGARALAVQDGTGG